MKKARNMKKQDNRGFSLVELIIVIAIMGILVGVVGTQVVPYMERSREAKDQQVLSSVATAVTSAVAMSGKSVGGFTSTKLESLDAAIAGEVAKFLLPEGATTKTCAEAQKYLANAFASKKAKANSIIYVSYFPADGKLYVYLTDGTSTANDIKKGSSGYDIGSNVTIYVESN